MWAFGDDRMIREVTFGGGLVCLLAQFILIITVPWLLIASNLFFVAGLMVQIVLGLVMVFEKTYYELILIAGIVSFMLSIFLTGGIIGCIGAGIAVIGSLGNREKRHDEPDGVYIKNKENREIQNLKNSFG
jgi:hypothetical protein